MKFKVEIDLENDAFQGNNDTELIRILREIIGNLERNIYTENIPYYEKDINGNTVGKSIFVNDKPAEPDNDYREFSRYKMN